MLSRLLGFAAIAACILLVPESRTGAQTTSAQGFQDIVVLTGLEQPTAVRFAPDGRVFVAEKSGLIKVFDNLSDTTATVFADLRTQVHNYWDRGLLGFALDPNFQAEPFVYVLYTRDADIAGAAPKWGRAGVTSDDCPTPPGGTADGCTVSGRLSRLQASGSVMVGAEQVLVDGWFQQYPSHSMGSIVFGPDGALYASGGDGASWQFVDYGQKGIPLNPGGDPPVPVGGTQTPPSAEGGALRSQDVRTAGDPVGLNGAVIRIDRRTGAPLPDNPLASSHDVNARRIVAYGLRNPFRMTFRPGTHELWIGDVGWLDWEEFNVVPDPRAAVKNFGWPCYEDRLPQPGYDAANLTLCEQLYAQPGAVTFAYWQYKEGVSINAGEACPNADASMTGLAFYQGGSYPANFSKALFFGDYTRRCIWAMLPNANGLPDPTRVSTIITGAETPVDLQVGPGGDIFYVDIAGGTIHRIVFSSTNEAPTAVIRATPTSGPVPLTVNFDGSQSFDPDATAPLTYVWDLDGDGVFGNSTAVNPSRVYSVAGTYRVGLRVTDAGGLTSTAFVDIHAGNSAPTANIATPSSTLRWRVGQQVSFSGSGTDPEQGALPASAMRWSLVMQHCSTATSCHQHPIQEFAGVASGSFVAPDHAYPSFLELSLTVTDSGGLSSTRTLRLDPQTVTITLNSSPSGLRVAAGSQSFTTPSAQTVIVGSAVSVSAPSPQTLSGTSYAFNSWSDGGAQTHTITAPATAQTYTARFVVAPTISLDRTSLQFGATNSGAAFGATTPNQTVRILQSGSGSSTWTATPTHPWITVSPSSGTGSATVTVGVRFNPTLPVSGTTTGAVNLTFAGAGNAVGPVSVTLTTMPPGGSAAPSGVVDTPSHGATGMTGSVSVTGWVVDDIGVSIVRVLRDPVPGEGASRIFLGNAVLLDGARPDIAAMFPTRPMNTKAGWGFLLLTNFLPNEGNGTFTIHAIADDFDGRSMLLGSKTITCANRTATRPFGAIDTPGQGETIGGASFANFGWVLARGPALAFPPNGTVRVVVDGAFLPGNPSGWTSRSNLTALFPSSSYPGVGHAAGVSTIDTRTLANGVHTIAWAVTANNGQSSGIGSRFFTVANGTGAGATAALRSPQSTSLMLEAAASAVSARTGDPHARDQINRAPLIASPIVGRRGYDPDAAYRTFTVGASGRAIVHGEELDRFELRLGTADSRSHLRYTGYLRVGDALESLPIGSRLDAETGLFTWQPGVGFLRAYDFVFARWDGGRVIDRQEIRIVINPTGSNRVGPQVVIDVPAENAGSRTVGQPFVVAGWAIDTDAGAGTGIDTLHVWAYPRDSCAGASCRADPIFLGAAAYGGRRPDVAAIFGEGFRESGYSLSVGSLPSGTYDIAVFAWSSVTGGFIPAKVVRVTVR